MPTLQGYVQPPVPIDAWLTVEDVEKRCKECADKMRAQHITKVRYSVFRAAMKRKAWELMQGKKRTG